MNTFRRSTSTSELAWCLIILAILFNSCRHDGGKQVNDPEYLAAIENWREERLQNLTAPRSWSSLVALKWFMKPHMTIGSDPGNDLVLDSLAPVEGMFTATDSTVHFQVDQNTVKVMHEGAPFDSGPVIQSGEAQGIVLSCGNYYWTVIRRGGQYAIRVWDTLAPVRKLLDTLPHFDVDPMWRIEVSIEPPLDDEYILMDNAVGQTIQYAVHGHVKGIVNGSPFSLVAIDGGPEELFIIFSDMTTDIQTYPGGRYIYIRRPDKTGRSILDFNKAYNPPCVYTDYATCLLPPRENHLPVEVRAGELYTAEH